MQFDQRSAHLLFCCFIAGGGVYRVAVREGKQPQQGFLKRWRPHGLARIGNVDYYCLNGGPARPRDQRLDFERLVVLVPMPPQGPEYIDQWHFPSGVKAVGQVGQFP